MKTTYRKHLLTVMCILLLLNFAVCVCAENAATSDLVNLARFNDVVATCVADDGSPADYGYTNKPQYAIDGIDRTITPTPQYYQAAEHNPLANLQIDLVKEYSISKISLNCSGNNYPKQFNLETSSDGITWNIEQTVTFEIAPSAEKYYEYEIDASARYVRIDVKENGGSYPATFFEVQVWGYANNLETGEVDLARGGIASMDYPCYKNPEHPAEHAIDGNYNSSTYAQSESADAPWSLTVDLQSVCEINRVKLETSKKNHAKDFTIEISNDGEKWTSIDTITNFAGGVYEKSFDNPAKARWIRMHVDSVQTSGWGHTVFYFSAYGTYVLPEPEVIDLALNGTAYMDYPCYMNPPHPAEHAIDGNYNSSTYAQSASSDAPWSLTVDLNTLCNIRSIKLETSKKNHAKDFTIEVSDDGEIWSAIDSASNFSGGIYEMTLPSAISARWVRMHVTSVETAGWGHTIFYLSVYGSYAQPETNLDDLGIQISSSALIATSSPSLENHPIENAFDNNDDTYWSPAETNEARITIDLQQHYDFSGIALKGSISNSGLIKVDTSEDGLRWYQDSKLLMTEFGAASTFTQNYRRYVRLTFPSTASLLRVNALYLYGTPSRNLSETAVAVDDIGTRPILVPLPTKVNNVETPIISLNGTWSFSLEPKSGYWQDGCSRAGWTDVELPGDAFAQGYIPYTLSENDQQYQHESAFEKIISIPAEFEGSRIVIRINGAINYSRLWVNGELVRTHRSGKTSWDTDITDFVSPGEDARITIGLTAENPQIDFSRVRGITGDITLFALPQNHLSRLHVVTDFDSEYNNANLIIQIGEMFNQQNSESEIHFTLIDPNGESVSLDNNSVVLCSPENSLINEQAVSNQIRSPIKWDAEHPALYTLVASLYNDNVLSEQVSLNFGFREIEISGKTLLVNGDIVKLRGVNITPSSPLIGVAADDNWTREILVKLKEANVNFIRTAHAPFTESFYALCDEMGFYVESEASIFFIGMSSVKQINPDSLKNDSNYTDSYLNAVSEMIEEFKSHPSILYWSIGNESNWGSNNVICHEYARTVDSTRPTKFSWGYEGGNIPEIYSVHYGLSSANTSVPNIWDEYAHGAIAVTEEKLDPGYQDCAETIDLLWNSAYRSSSCIGGAIWSANDRTTYTLSGKVNPKYNVTNGCGWGFLDAWGREKPGYWNVKKAYSPFKIADETRAFENPGSGLPLEITVENRFNHTNLNECTVNWSVGSENGILSGPNVEKRNMGTLTIPARDWENGDILKLTIMYQGMVIDEYALSIGKKAAPIFSSEETGTIRIDATNDVILGDTFAIEFDQETGLIKLGTQNGKETLCGGPILNLGTRSVGTWKKESFSMSLENNKAVVTISGKYDSKISATFVLSIDSAGLIETQIFATGIPSDYNELGIAYIAPSNVESLQWKRNGYWSTYPEEHLGRNEGIAMKVYANGYISPAIKPNCTWSEDMQNYFMFGDNDSGGRGSNDFRSRKTNYYYAELIFDNGAILRAENTPKDKGTSDGTTASVRAQVQNDGTIRFNLNSLWIQKGNNNWNYATPITDTSGVYNGCVKLRMTSGASR